MTATAKIRLFKATLEDRGDIPRPQIMVRLVDREGQEWCTPSLSEGLAHLLSDHGHIMELWEVPASNLPPYAADDDYGKLVYSAAIVSISCKPDHSKLHYGFGLPYSPDEPAPGGEPIEFGDPADDQFGPALRESLHSVTVELDHPREYHLNNGVWVPFLDPERT